MIACVGRLRYGEHRSIPEIHHELTRRGVDLAQRSVLPISWISTRHLRAQRPLIRNGCNGCCRSNPVSSWPSMACNPMSVTRFSGFSATVSRAKSSWPGACSPPPAAIWRRCCPRCAGGLASAYHGRHLGRPADDPPSRGPGIAGRAASVVPLPLPLREAARPIYEADRHAKKELKKRIRGVRPI